MPVRLASLSLLLACLAGCTTPPPVRSVHTAPPNLAAETAVSYWLTLQAKVAAMPLEAITAELADLPDPENKSDLFYRALLRQYSQTYNGWVQARDTFRQLREDIALPPEERQLAGILEQFNQNRINWFQRYGELQQQYNNQRDRIDELQRANASLEEKIRTLTDLEAEISTRKEP